MGTYNFVIYVDEYKSKEGRTFRRPSFSTTFRHYSADGHFKEITPKEIRKLTRVAFYDKDDKAAGKIYKTSLLERGPGKYIMKVTDEGGKNFSIKQETEKNGTEVSTLFVAPKYIVGCERMTSSHSKGEYLEIEE